MIFPTTLTLTVVAFASIVSAQSTGLAAIKAHFTQSRVVPELIPEFSPTAELAVSFGGAVSAPGQLYGDLTAVAPTPSLVLSMEGTSGLDGQYTIIMADADIVGNTEQASFPTRHWLVNGMKLATDGSLSDNSSAVAVTTYAGPAPADGSGPHRYTILIYEQPSTFNAPEAFSQPNIGVSTFSLTEYVSGSGLGPLIAGYYFNVEVGTSAAEIPATTSVNSATLAGESSAAPSGSASQTTRPASETASAPAGSATDVPANGASRVAVSVVAIIAAAGFALFL